MPGMSAGMMLDADIIDGREIEKMGLKGWGRRFRYPRSVTSATAISGQVEVLILNLTKIANTTGPNGTAEQGSALSDPIVQALLVGVAILGVAVVVLGRRGRAPEAPRARGQDEYGSDETSAVDAPDGAGPGPPTN